MVKTEKLLEWIAMDQFLKLRGKSVFCEACQQEVAADQKCHVKQVHYYL